MRFAFEKARLSRQIKQTAVAILSLRTKKYDSEDQMEKIYVEKRRSMNYKTILAKQ